VSNVTLHNEDEVLRKDVRVGDWVVVRRAGDVIPELVAPILELRKGNPAKFKMPAKCPVCGTPVERTKGKAVTRCPNATCPATDSRTVDSFRGRGAMDIEGLGRKLSTSSSPRGCVSDPSDFYHLSVEKLADLERMGGKSAQNVINAIEGSKRTTMGDSSTRSPFPVSVKRWRSCSHPTCESIDDLWKSDQETLSGFAASGRCWPRRSTPGRRSRPIARWSSGCSTPVSRCDCAAG
jgi:hypothetical protein